MLGAAAFRLSGGLSSFFRAHAEATRYRAYAGTHEPRPWLSVPVTVTMSHGRTLTQPAASELNKLPEAAERPGPQHDLPENYTILPPVKSRLAASPVAPVFQTLQIFSAVADHNFFLSPKLRVKK